MSDREIQEHFAGRAVKPTYITVENDSMRLFVASIGPDTLPPLLLIHGAPGSWYGYLKVIDDTLIQKQFHILAVDRPGYGKSRKGRKPYTSITRQAQWIAHALNLNHSGRKAVVLGRSYGAPIAARLAMLYPGRIKHLFLVAAPLDPTREKYFWFSKWGKLPPIQLFLPRQLNLATAEKFTHVSELRQMEPLWPKLNVPVTLLHGGRDWLVDPKNLEFAKGVLAGKPAEFIFLPDAGHMITNSHTELVRKLIFDSVGFGAQTAQGSAN
ncbi:alpha/beta fold hydrolase [Larkinella soli]|uniref:alpha/beta fold hydrolase n=1 Tax=Larkinella soli TaxID=1770527 RepID=UPI000FFCB897|nr:alpha/beta fold hydrolase [Larkinella soli]